MAIELLEAPERHIGSVININFPAETTTDTPVVSTFPAKLQLGALFAETSPGKYSFRYSNGTVVDSHPESDRAVLESGRISRSILNFSRIGRLDSK